MMFRVGPRTQVVGSEGGSAPAHTYGMCHSVAGWLSAKEGPDSGPATAPAPSAAKSPPRPARPPPVGGQRRGARLRWSTIVSILRSRFGHFGGTRCICPPANHSSSSSSSSSSDCTKVAAAPIWVLC